EQVEHASAAPLDDRRLALVGGLAESLGLAKAPRLRVGVHDLADRLLLEAEKRAHKALVGLRQRRGLAVDPDTDRRIDLERVGPLEEGGLALGPAAHLLAGDRLGRTRDLARTGTGARSVLETEDGLAR